MNAPTAPPAFLEPEVLDPFETEVQEETALTQRAEQSFLARMERIENAAAIFEKRAELLEMAYLIAIKRTRPEDWVLFRAPDGSTNALLKASGADLVADVFGVQIEKIRPVDHRGIFSPEKVPVTGRQGVYTLRAWCDCHSRITGRAFQNLEASRRSDEKFTGRVVDGAELFIPKDGNALESDLRAAVQTLLRTKAVRVICGMTRVPVRDLERAWKETGKSTDHCTKGSGFGSSSERKAQEGASADVAAGAEEVWKEILRRVGGDESAAHQVLKEITAYPANAEKGYKAFAGCKSWQEINTTTRVEKARRNLEKHPQFGDRREPGED